MVLAIWTKSGTLVVLDLTLLPLRRFRARPRYCAGDVEPERGACPVDGRGRDEVREWLRELAEAFAEFQIEISEIRDLGERLVTISQLRGRGKESGAEVQSPIGYVIDFKNGKAVRVRDYFDPKKALEAAGLSE